MARQDFGRPIIRQPRQKDVSSNRDLQIPGSRAVMPSNFLDHAKHGDGTDLKPTERSGTSHRVQARFEHSIDYRGGEVALPFCLCSLLADYRSDLLDGIEQRV